MGVAQSRRWRGPVWKRTAGADPISYCPDGKSRSLPDSLFGPARGWEGNSPRAARWGSRDSRGRCRVGSSRIRFRMSSALGTGMPSSDSRRRARVRSTRVHFLRSSAFGGRVTSSSSPPGVSIRTTLPMSHSVGGGRRVGAMIPRLASGLRRLFLLPPGWHRRQEP